jgi:hypothetical protein
VSVNDDGDDHDDSNDEPSIIYSVTDDTRVDKAHTSQDKSIDDSDDITPSASDSETVAPPSSNEETATVDKNENDTIHSNGHDENQTIDIEYMKSLQIGYNACIHAWAQSFCVEAAIECERLLQEMLDSTYVQPNTATFNTCYYGTIYKKKMSL